MRNKKFNVIDFVIIFVIIAVICVAGYIYFSKTTVNDAVTTNTVDFKFTVEVNDLTEDGANSYTIGDLVTFGESTSGAGEIVDVEVSSYRKPVENKDDGTFVWSEVPGRYTARVTIQCSVNKTDYDYTCGSEIIAVGRKMPFNAVGAAAEECYIVDLSEVE